MKYFIKPIFAVLIFVIWQLIVSFFAVVVKLISNKELYEAFKVGKLSFNSIFTDTSDGTLAISLIISGVLAIVSMYVIGVVNKRTVINPAVIKWKWLPLVFLGAFSGIFASDLLLEWFPLVNNLETQFLALSRSFWGIIAIGIVGPISEEYVFREAIIGHLVRNKINPWIAIFFSAICFGCIHGNPIQIPFAIIAGVIFGVIYVRTGNILLTSVIHILNNSIAVALMNILGSQSSEITYKELLGCADIPAIVLLAVLCVCVLLKFWKNYKPIYI